MLFKQLDVTFVNP